MNSTQNIDVICQFCRDGSIIPIKLRLQDENGELQSYVVHGYMEYPAGSTYKLPNGFSATNTIHVFKCKIHCFGMEKILYIYYNASSSQWHIVNNQPTPSQGTPSAAS